MFWTYIAHNAGWLVVGLLVIGSAVELMYDRRQKRLEKKSADQVRLAELRTEHLQLELKLKEKEQEGTNHDSVSHSSEDRLHRPRRRPH